MSKKVVGVFVRFSALQLLIFALNINLPVEGLIRATVFDHFWRNQCKDCLSVVDKMHTKEFLLYWIIQWKERG
jgi:hypothetical protein